MCWQTNLRINEGLAKLLTGVLSTSLAPKGGGGMSSLFSFGKVQRCHALEQDSSGVFERKLTEPSDLVDLFLQQSE